MYPYSGITAALTTKHKKSDYISQPLREIGISLSTFEYDTDKFGTFSGEIERIGSPAEVIRKKARVGMAETKLPFGIASEGSFGPDPIVPFFNSNVEFLIWIDDLRGIEIIESFRTLEIQAHREEIETLEKLKLAIPNFDFPKYSLIVKGKSKLNSLIFKGLSDFPSLETSVKRILDQGDIAIVENDLRAHLNPKRQKAITEVAIKLSKRIMSTCKKCGTPGWGAVGQITGLTCEICDFFNSQYPSGEINGCLKCDYQEEKLFRKQKLTAAECLFCNP